MLCILTVKLSGLFFTGICFVQSMWTLRLRWARTKQSVDCKCYPQHLLLKPFTCNAWVFCHLIGCCNEFFETCFLWTASLYKRSQRISTFVCKSVIFFNQWHDLFCILIFRAILRMISCTDGTLNLSSCEIVIILASCNSWYGKLSSTYYLAYYWGKLGGGVVSWLDSTIKQHLIASKWTAGSHNLNISMKVEILCLIYV